MSWGGFIVWLGRIDAVGCSHILVFVHVAIKPSAAARVDRSFKVHRESTIEAKRRAFPEVWFDQILIVRSAVECDEGIN